ncbi:MAG: hypothetical protein HYY05_01225 [Chloroflexi bacterium]|nr:hypothetical protein [Chloroflexota bacterium]
MVTVALAVAVAGALVLVGNQTTPPTSPLTVAVHGNTLGPASAPVQVEEWGDFQ